MSLISRWSTTPNANGTLGSTPFYWPENQAPSTVNDCARQMMATIRTQWNDAAWFNWGYTVTRVSGNSFTVVTASWNTVTLPAAFEVDGRIKCYDTSTIYGTITTVSVSAASTLVTFTPDAFSLTSSFTSVYNSIIPPTNTPIPGLNIPTNVVTQQMQQIYAVDSGATNSAQITLSPVLPAYANGLMVNVKFANTNTGATTLQIDALGSYPVRKYGGTTALDAGDIRSGQITTLEFDTDHWEMQSQLANAFMDQQCSQIYAADSSGTDAYVITLSPALASYETGQMINFTAGTSNTGAATLNVNGLGAASIKKQFNQDLATGDILAGQMVTVVYDGSNWEMQSQTASGGGGGGGSSDALTKTITQAAHGFVVGQVVYWNGTEYALAQANAASTAEVIGLITAVPSVNSFTITTGGFVSTLAGLTNNTVYFLSDSVAGALTATPPTTAGYIEKPLLITVSTSSGYFFNYRGRVIPDPAPSWQFVSTATNIVSNTYYCVNGASVAFTLPTTANRGDLIYITCYTDGWTLAQNAGQQIRIGSNTTTLGAGGSLASTATGDTILLLCVADDTTFLVLNMVGNITYV